MTGSFAAEILKLRKRPATWILLGVALALNQLFGYILPYSSWVTGGQNEQTQGLDPQAVLAGTLPGELVPTSLGGFPVFAGALALILGGALGNLVDRITTGLVVDFIEVGVGRYRWPVFNVADTAIVVGAGLIGLSSLIELIKERRQPHGGVAES